MDNFLSFGSFDIIAYLMVGLAAFMVLDLVLSFGFLYRAEWNTGSVTGIVILAYLGGHLISIPSRELFESWTAKDCLKEPVIHLFLGNRDPTILVDPKTHKHLVSWGAGDYSASASFVCQEVVKRIVRGEYFKEATQDVVRRIEFKSDYENYDAEAFFRQAFVVARHDPNSYERMDIFQRLSILFRNMAFLAFAAFVIVLLKEGLLPFGVRLGDRHLIYYGVRPWMLNTWVQMVFFLVLTVGLLDRYLFFHRLFALEAVTAFAYAPPVIF